MSASRRRHSEQLPLQRPLVADEVEVPSAIRHGGGGADHFLAGGSGLFGVLPEARAGAAADLILVGRQVWPPPPHLRLSLLL